MTIPITLGLPQLVLLLVAVVGLGLIITSARGGRERPGHVKAGRAISGLLLICMAGSLLWAIFAVQSYLGLTSDIQAARVHATQIEGEPHLMSIELILYDKDGQQTSNKTYLVKGDKWELRGNIIKFPSWLNILGLHSGYKVTQMEGLYDDPNLESNEKHTVVVLNGGEGDFFKTVYQQAWSSPFVDAAYGNGTYEPADGHTYDIFVSQTGLYAKPAR